MVQKCKIDDAFEKVDKTTRLSKRIDKDINDLKEIVDSAPIGLIESFKRYTDPQSNLEELIKFYKLFLNVGERVTNNLKKLKELNITNIESDSTQTTKEAADKSSFKSEKKYQSKKTNSDSDKSKKTSQDLSTKLSLDSLTENYNSEILSSELKCVEIYFKVKNDISDLEYYKDINVVKKFNADSQEEINKIIEPIHKNFFKTIPCIIDSIEDGSIKNITELQSISFFLFESEEKKFIEKYCKTLLKKYSHKNTENEQFVVKLKNIGEVFEKIERVGEFLLPESNRKIINDQIEQLLFIELKDITAKVLLDLEKKYKNENIISVCKLYIAICMKKLEYHFHDFKEECLRIINDLLMKFISNIENEKKPIKTLRNEKWLLFVYGLVKLFVNNECLEKDFFKIYNENFEFTNASELRDYFGKLTFEKIFSLAGLLKGIQKNIYLLNNLHMIDLFYKDYRGKKVNVYFGEYTHEIVEMWRSECEKRKRDEKRGQEFLNLNLDIQKKYFLPDEMREYLVEKVSEVVEEFVKVNGYKNGREVLNFKLSKLFSGE